MGLSDLRSLPYTRTVARLARKKLVDAVTAHYLTSGDFNGTSISSINASDKERRKAIAEMVTSGKLSVEFGDEHPNAYVKAFPSPSVQEQLKNLASADFQYACVYPSNSHLAAVVGQSQYAGQPYTLRLALGAGQMEYVSFDLAVLERYRNDPRYHYDTNDFSGKIVVKTEDYLSPRMPERDKVLLETFGFGHDKDVTVRVVAVFLRYLRHLSPEHQEFWKSHEIAGEYLLHPVYRDIALGNWYTGISILRAITEEMRVINGMCERMKRPPLFKEDYTGDKRPRKFGFLLRPTLEEFNAFVQLLEKMLSGNINFAFFKDEVAAEYMETRSDGTVVAKPKGSVTMLKEWLATNFTPSGPGSAEELERMFATFRKIIRMRQQPAHVLNDDVLDQAYFRQQRELVIETYHAVRALRMAFSTHPDAVGYEVPGPLLKGRIWKE